MTDTIKHEPDCAVNELSYGVNPCTCGASTAKPPQPGAARRGSMGNPKVYCFPVIVCDDAGNVTDTQQNYVLASDYAALEARNARVIEWMRGKCECCGTPEKILACNACLNGPHRAGTDNWKLPAGLEV